MKAKFELFLKKKNIAFMISVIDFVFRLRGLLLPFFVLLFL